MTSKITLLGKWYHSALAGLALHDPEQLDLKEQDFGYKYNPHSRLQDPGLDVQPIEVLAFDWMHCWAEGG